VENRGGSVDNRPNVVRFPIRRPDRMGLNRTQRDAGDSTELRRLGRVAYTPSAPDAQRSSISEEQLFRGYGVRAYGPGSLVGRPGPVVYPGRPTPGELIVTIDGGDAVRIRDPLAAYVIALLVHAAEEQDG